jgi:hypothetical protein
MSVIELAMRTRVDRLDSDLHVTVADNGESEAS